MTSRELARILLNHTEMPVATHANNHTYMSSVDAQSHGPLKVGILKVAGDIDHIIIGNISKKNINKPNWYVTQMINGEASEEWRS